MKKLTEMNDQELNNAIAALEKIEFEGATETLKQLKEEKAKREAEREAKRKEMEAKRAEAEAKKQAEAEKEENAFVEKQKSVLGKCYKRRIYSTEFLYPTPAYMAYYKVIGVYDDKAIVSVVKEHESSYFSRSVSYININDLLDAKKEYNQITLSEFNKKYDNATDTITKLTNVFNDLIGNMF